MVKGQEENLAQAITNNLIKSLSSIFLRKRQSTTISSSSESNGESSLVTHAEVSLEDEDPGSNKGKPADSDLEDKGNLQRDLKPASPF